MNTTFEEKKATKELTEKCAIYLNENFHKFSQSNKIKIALEIFKRKMPQPVTENGQEDWVKYPMRLIPVSGNGHGKEEADERNRAFIN
jgi:hypothetical protein